jgi:hypothetical protein
VAVGSDATEEEVNSAVGFDCCFVGYAFGFEIWCVAVQDVDVFWVDVDVGEEMIVHECVVGFGVLAGDPNVFILLLKY